MSHEPKDSVFVGDGDPGCPKCRGRGVVSVTMDGIPGGSVEPCICVFRRDLEINVRRIWPVLLTVTSVPSSPLMKYTKRSMWVTGTSLALQRHLRFVAYRMGTSWNARVITDATLMTAWLSTAKEVRDVDVAVARQNPSDDFQTLVDLVLPFDLLVIRLGVKAAANKEMSNVLAEALNERDQAGKATWVVDSPGHPLVRGSHMCYSAEVAEILSGFGRIVLPEEAATPETPYGLKASVLPSTPAAQRPHYAPPPVQSRTPTPPPEAQPNPPVRASQSAPRPNVSSGGGYAPKKVSLEQVVVTPIYLPSPEPEPVPYDPNEDEFSVGNLIAAAVNPTPSPPLEEDFEDDGDDEARPLRSGRVLPEQDLIADMRTNGTPSWLKGSTKK